MINPQFPGQQQQQPKAKTKNEKTESKMGNKITWRRNASMTTLEELKEMMEKLTKVVAVKEMMID